MAAISCAAMFLVGGYEFIRSASMSLFIENYGSANLPYAMTAIIPVLALLIYAYARALSRWGALRALTATTIGTLLVFTGCYIGIKAGWKPATLILYVYREAYIVILIEQYWSMVNSTLTPQEAKVYNGPITGGSSIGPITAGLIMSRFALDWGTEAFILLGTASLFPAIAMSFAAYRLAGEPQPSEKEKEGKEGHLNLKLFSRSHTLMYLGLIVVLTQVLSTLLSLRFYSLLEFSIALKDARTAYLGGFWSTINGFSFLLQFILTPLIMRRASLRFIHVGIPIIHVAACGAVLFLPTLPVAATALILFKGFDYSFFRAAKEILYIPLSYDARYRAKQIIDSLGYRFSKGGTAGLMSAATAALGTIPPAAYAIGAAAAAVCWSALAWPMTEEKTKPQTFS